MQGDYGIGVIDKVDTIHITGLNEPYKVIVYNDQIHTFDQVIIQLVKATHCKRQDAKAKAEEIHTRGKAVVFVGEPAKCFEVSAVLDEIKLHVNIEV